MFKLKIKTIILLAFVVLLTELVNSKLVGVIEVSRHGARTGNRNFGLADITPNSGYFYSDYLTPVGMHQHYVLGHEFRERYVHYAKLLSNDYKPEEIDIRSSFTTRTFISAFSQALGLYPPEELNQELTQDQRRLVKPPFNLTENIDTSLRSALPYGFTPIPIKTSYAGKDYILRILKNSTCPPIVTELNQAIQQRLKTNPIDDFDMIKILKRELKNLTEDVTLEYIDDFTDYLEMIRYHEIDLNVDDISVEEFQQISSYRDKFQYPWNLTKTLNSAGSTAFFQEILDHFNALATNGEYKKFVDPQAELLKKKSLLLNAQSIEKPEPYKPPKFLYFSAHETTINTFMNGLGVPQVLRPPLASTLIFELHYITGNNYNVIIKYNDEVIKLPACDSTSCKLDQFNSYLNSMLIAGGIDEYCKPPKTSLRALSKNENIETIWINNRH